MTDFGDDDFEFDDIDEDAGIPDDEDYDLDGLSTDDDDIDDEPHRPVSAQERRIAARDQLILASLAQGDTYRRAASVGNCSIKTVARRVADPEFAARLDELRARHVSVTSGALTAQGPRAVRVLTRLLDSEDDATAFRAAREVLAQGFRSRQLHDLETQVREIRAELERLRNTSSGGGDGVGPAR